MKLYSFGPGANSLKPLLSLYEKELEFESVFLNPAKFEHHADWYKKLNPNGQVPALEHEDKIITESTVICEYLEDAYPDQNPLRPRSHFERAQMRIWTKWVDEYFCWCVSTIGWHRMVGNMVKHLSDAEFDEMVAKVPLKEQQVKWRRAREGFPQEMLDEEMRKIDYSIKKLEASLTGKQWLVADQFTLADICNFAIANNMQNGFPEFVNDKATPSIIDWLARINDRPAAKKMFANQPSEFNRKPATN